MPEQSFVPIPVTASAEVKAASSIAIEAERLRCIGIVRSLLVRYPGKTDPSFYARAWLREFRRQAIRQIEDGR